MFPLMQAGLVRVLAADPKLMELAYGRAIFDTYGHYAADPAAIAAMLDAAVADMQDRASRFAGRQRDHTPTGEDPFTVVLVDEVAFLTAYQPDRKLKERIMLALATLTTQGRALGYCRGGRVAGPAQGRADHPEPVPRPDRHAAGRTRAGGHGARRRRPGPRRHLRADLARPGYRRGGGVRPAGGDPDPVRVRAGWVSDADIRALAAACLPEPEPIEPIGWPEVAA